MKHSYMKTKLSIMVSILFGSISSAYAAPFVQCKGDTGNTTNNPNAIAGDAIVDEVGPEFDNVKCMHLAAGDGFIKMADGRLQYMFGFSDMTGIPQGRCN